MAELYKGQAGSPITYLTADITANQSTIVVSDGDSLPQGPNIATIGYGDYIETIKYENNSNGTLTGITRGVEGTPRAWQAGTEVARFFTAYDHNRIVDEITNTKDDLSSHLAENVSHITTVTRDVSLTGSQTINLIPGRTPQSVRIYAAIRDTPVASWGIDDSCICQIYNGDMYNHESYAVYLFTAAGVVERGIITKNNGNIVLNWGHVGSPSGTARIVIEALYHGSDE